MKPWSRTISVTARALLVTVLATVASLLPTAGEAGQRHRWWQSGEIKAELHISDEQSETLEEL